ncbi:MAG: DUF4124 domain-containing protein [Gammaproteobacteria bacterium]|nr:DUF4124 domain-containing protein [Gammaproteobacteria bacterium]
MSKLTFQAGIAIALLIAMAGAGLASAAAYRWTDAAGNVQYGDRPPAGVEATRLAPPPPPPADAIRQNRGEPSGEAPARAADTGSGRAEPSGTGDDRLPPPPPPPADAIRQNSGEPSAEALTRDAQRRAREAAEMARVRQQNCKAARSNLEILQRDRPVRLRGDDDVNNRRLSKEERQGKIREAQQQIRENCN